MTARATRKKTKRKLNRFHHVNDLSESSHRRKSFITFPSDETFARLPLRNDRKSWFKIPPGHQTARFNPFRRVKVSIAHTNTMRHPSTDSLSCPNILFNNKGDGGWERGGVLIYDEPRLSSLKIPNNWRKKQLHQAWNEVCIHYVSDVVSRHNLTWAAERKRWKNIALKWYTISAQRACQDAALFRYSSASRTIPADVERFLHYAIVEFCERNFLVRFRVSHRRLATL